jgi:NTE family protein
MPVESPHPAQEVSAVAKPSPAASGKPTCVLALQGGGALGAYHIGAYQALAEHGFEPDWFSGISIGAINSAVLAGTPPAERVARLEELWRLISWPEVFRPLRVLPLDILHNTMSNAEALVMGQPHFFRPRPVNPFFAPAGPPTQASFYDTSPMLETLRRLVDFDLINAGPARLTLGATDVETGRFVFFDSAKPEGGPIGPAHVLASGSLPPGFPPTEIGGRYYWDGGCVSNTPAEAVLADQPPGHTLLFMIDLWNGAGPAPTTMNEVLWRAKQIQYASRGHLLAEHLAVKANLRHHAARAAAIAAASDRPEGKKPGAAAAARAVGHDRLDIFHIIYQPGRDQIPNSDAEFSRASIEARREAGYRDMKALLAQQPWRQPAAALAASREVPPPGGAVLHRVRQGRVETQVAPGLRPAAAGVARTVA